MWIVSCTEYILMIPIMRYLQNRYIFSVGISPPIEFILFRVKLYQFNSFFGHEPTPPSITLTVGNTLSPS